MFRLELVRARSTTELLSSRCDHQRRRLPQLTLWSTSCTMRWKVAVF
jgi:hypothetical protein